LDDLIVVYRSCFFRSDDFFVQRKVTRGQSFALSLLTTSVKNFTGMVKGIEKIKSIVRFENFKVRAYMLQCNTASSQATMVRKT
jgi:hypothetical protein